MLHVRDSSVSGHLGNNCGSRIDDFPLIKFKVMMKSNQILGQHDPEGKGHSLRCSRKLHNLLNSSAHSYWQLFDAQPSFTHVCILSLKPRGRICFCGKISLCKRNTFHSTKPWWALVTTMIKFHPPMTKIKQSGFSCHPKLPRDQWRRVKSWAWLTKLKTHSPCTDLMHMEATNHSLYLLKQRRSFSHSGNS